MKIPKNIQDKMHKVARLNQESAQLMIEIDEYFINKGFDIEQLRSGSGNGKSLEELEYGNDITNDFVEEAENDFKSGLWHL